MTSVINNPFDAADVVNVKKIVITNVSVVIVDGGDVCDDGIACVVSCHCQL